MRGEKILQLVVEVGIVLTALFALSVPVPNTIYLFILLYTLGYWQRRRLQGWLRGWVVKRQPRLEGLLFLLIGWLGGLGLELVLVQLPFHPRLGVDILIGAGFYPAYFLFWYHLVKQQKFNFLEVFYLSGLSRVIFDSLVSRKLFVATGLLAFGGRLVATFILFGALTTLPYLFLVAPAAQQRQEHTLREYLVGLTPLFLAAGVLLVWIGLLKGMVALLAG